MIFVGTRGGMERPMVEKSGVPFVAYHEVLAGPLHGVAVWVMLWSVCKLALGWLMSLGIVLRHRPDVVLNTGGWAAVPVSAAAWVLRVPVVVYLPDIEPGLTIRAMRPIATRMAATTAASAPYIPPRKLAVTGYPLRRAVLSATRAQGLAHFGLDPAKRTLLVFGGSRGARSINVAVIEALPRLLAAGDLQIIHVTGELDADRAEAVRHTADYHPFAYLHDDMGLALAAADLCVCRSGASTLGELPYFGLPSILVPYPHAWRYQKVNADYLAEHGAALVLRDEDMPAQLADLVRALLDDPARLEAMRQAARALSQGDAAANLVELLRHPRPPASPAQAAPLSSASSPANGDSRL
jgi:UDP-N-acetylglucosamine--N-acetylmuramyl-(pentapeptide) pyrophosphoryl-undecaprenol N-acetylglucosamine transferase